MIDIRKTYNLFKLLLLSVVISPSLFSFFVSFLLYYIADDNILLVENSLIMSISVIIISFTFALPTRIYSFLFSFLNFFASKIKELSGKSFLRLIPSTLLIVVVATAADTTAESKVRS